MPIDGLDKFVAPYIMESQPLTEKEKTDLLKRELEASKEVIDRLTRIIMTKQTDEGFPACHNSVLKENTELKKRIAELKHTQETNLAIVTRKKDFQIQELQRKIEQTVSEREQMANKLESLSKQHETDHSKFKNYIVNLESKLMQSNSTVKALNEDIDSKQEIINKQQKELETANIELRYYQFREEVNQLLSGIASGVDNEIKSLMEEYGVDSSGISVKFVVEEHEDD